MAGALFVAAVTGLAGPLIVFLIYGGQVVREAARQWRRGERRRAMANLVTIAFVLLFAGSYSMSAFWLATR